MGYRFGGGGSDQPIGLLGNPLASNFLELQMNRISRLSSLGIALALWSGATFAQSEAVGHVKTVKGDAWVTTSGQRVKAQPGTPVAIGSQLKTAGDASLGVTFKDNTRIAFGPDTELVVDEYLYAPAKGQLKLGTRMTQGTLNYVSGQIARLKPDAVSVKTPAGIIGLRGTQFVLLVEEQR